MLNYLQEYCEYTEKFKTNHNLIIMDSELVIVSILNVAFFNKYTAGFKIGANILDCLGNLPLMKKKQQIYNELIVSKKVQGYFICQNLNNDGTHVIDRVYLSPILAQDGGFIGVELECISMDGLPLINIIDSIEDYDLHLPNFTKREHEIIVLKTLGKSNLEISTILSQISGKNVAEKTVASIIYNQIYRKLNVNNKSDLIKVSHQRVLDVFLPKSLLHENQLVAFSPATF